MAKKQEGAGAPASETKPPAGDTKPPAGEEVKPDAGGPKPDPAADKPNPIEPKDPAPLDGVLEVKAMSARDMFGSFMVAVASRNMAVHQPANEIADIAERLTQAWLERKDKFAD